MFDQVPERSPGVGRILRVFVGFLGGLVAGLIIPLIVFSLTRALMGPRGGRGAFAVAEILSLAILVFCGRLAYKAIDRSALAVGLLIGISLAFLLSAICGIVMLSVR